MCENCVTDIPTKQSGSFDGQLRAFVKDLLSSLDVQLWWQEHSGSIRQPFKNLVAMWMKDLEIVNATSESSWRSNIESVLATYAADGRGDSDVIARTLKNAIREANDTSAPETLKYLERLVEANFNGTRDAVGAWVRMQRKIPVAIVIARGILQPLIAASVGLILMWVARWTKVVAHRWQHWTQLTSISSSGVGRPIHPCDQAWLTSARLCAIWSPQSNHSRRHRCCCGQRC